MKSRRQQTFSVQGQTVNILAFISQSLCCNYLTATVCESSVENIELMGVAMFQ